MSVTTASIVEGIRVVYNDNSDPEMRIIYSPHVSAPCSIGKEIFDAEIEIEYIPVETLIEYMSFEKWLLRLYDQPMTIEEITRLIFDTLRLVLGDIQLRVTVSATTTVHAPVKATIKT